MTALLQHYEQSAGILQNAGRKDRKGQTICRGSETCVHFVFDTEDEKIRRYFVFDTKDKKKEDKTGGILCLTQKTKR